MLFRLLFILSIFVSFNINAKDSYKTLTADIVEILNHTMGSSDDENIKIEIDKTTLLYELIEDNQKVDCMKYHPGYIDEPNRNLLGRVESGTAKFKLNYPGVDLSKFAPYLVSLEKGKKRILILKGQFNGEEVYFRLEINDKKEALISYIPINTQEEKEKEIITAEAILEDTTPSELRRIGYQGEQKLVGAKGEILVGGQGSQVQWEATEGESTGTLVLRTEDRPEKLTIGIKKREDAEEEITGSIETEVGALKTKVDANVVEDQTAVGGTVTLSEGNSSVQVRVDHKEEVTKTNVSGQTEIGKLKLTAQHSGEVGSDQFNVDTSAGLDINDQNSLRATYSTDEKSNETVGVEYSYTTTNGKTEVGVRAKAIVIDESETELETSVSVSHKTNNDKDTILLTVSPSTNEGEIDTVKIESRLDRKISDSSTIGVYANTTVSDDEAKRKTDVGVQFKTEFAGPNENIEMLKVYTLYKVDVVKGSDGDFKKAYHQVWYYHCDKKKKKLKVTKPKKRLFKGYVLEDMADSAWPLDAQVPSEYTIPKGVDKNTFCSFK